LNGLTEAEEVRALMEKLPDLERMLLKLLATMVDVNMDDLEDQVAGFPNIQPLVEQFDQKVASEEHSICSFEDEEYDAIQKEIDEVKKELKDYRKKIAKKLKCNIAWKTQTVYLHS
jgi:Skp family chaperone for outer membrane proteins